MHLIKHIILLLLLSFGIVFSMTYAAQIIQTLLDAHDWVSQILSEVFAGSQTGSLIKNLLALLAIPFLIAFVPTILYWIIRRHFFPYFLQIVWVIWLLQAGAVIVVSKAIT